MGLGDEIMVTAVLKKMQLTKPVFIVDQTDRARWHPVWNHNPNIIDPTIMVQGGELLKAQRIVNCTGHRQYLNNKGLFQDWGIIPGEIFLTDKEKRLYKHIEDMKYIAIDPHARILNKDWGWHRFETIVKSLPSVNFIQPMYNRDCKPIKEHNVAQVEVRGLRQFLSIIHNSSAALCNEGGLHHTAAAFGKTAFVIFGGYIHPDVTGYAFHHNFATEKETCQRLKYCSHCRASLNKISPEQVIQKILETRKYWEK